MAPQFIGIDFGTSNSSAAWFNPETRKAEVLLNEEREEKTPSLVYFGADETLVGKPAENRLIDSARLSGEERGLEMQRFVKSIKRHLLSPPVIPLPDERDVTPVDVAAAIIGKLKRDAEELHFHEPVTRAVITYPAVYDAKQYKTIEKAARRAGFEEVELMKEPVAAALAFSRAGRNVGDCVLVYDLGGGTFDLALLTRDPDREFRLGMKTGGDARCGGDDFDLALYDFWDSQFRERRNRPISGAEGVIDLRFLRECRLRKENLSISERCEFSSLIPGGRTFKTAIDRQSFEGLIDAKVGRTIQLTGEMMRQAREQGMEVNSLVLIGGSSEIPLVRQMLKSRLEIEPVRWQHRDWAVALGAAYHGQSVWGERNRVSKAAAKKSAKDDKQQNLYREAKGRKDFTGAAPPEARGAAQKRKASDESDSTKTRPGQKKSPAQKADKPRAAGGASPAGGLEKTGKNNARTEAYAGAKGRKDYVGRAAETGKSTQAKERKSLGTAKSVADDLVMREAGHGGRLVKGGGTGVQKSSGGAAARKNENRSVQPAGSTGCVVLMAAALLLLAAAGGLGVYALAAGLGHALVAR